MPLPTLSGTVERHWDVMKRHIDPISSVNIALALASHKLGLEKSMGDPVIIKFEPSIACQLRCDCCRGGRTRQDLLGSKASRFMDINLYRKIMDEVGDTLLEASLYDEGEPLLCPDIVEMVKIAAERNVGTVISTNASFNPDSQVYRERLLGVADAGLDKMIIALDGLDAETHQAYRKGSNFYHVLANMQMLAQYVQENDLDMVIEWQMIGFSEDNPGHWLSNAAQQEEASKIAAEMGVEFRVIPNGIVNNQNQEYRRKGRCIIPYITVSVDFQGNVGGCLVYDSPGLDMGVVDPETPLLDIWNSEQFQLLRKEHYKPENGALDPALRCYRCSRFGG